MFAQRFLNLQRRYLVPTRLEDVNIRPSQDAIHTVLDDSSVAGAKPAIAERIVRRLWLAPVFCENARAADLDLAGRARRHRFATLADKLYFHARQGRADAARHALAPVGVRQRHPDLRHAITLQQRVAANFLPAFE